MDIMDVCFFFLVGEGRGRGKEAKRDNKMYGSERVFAIGRAFCT